MRTVLAGWILCTVPAVLSGCAIAPMQPAPSTVPHTASIQAPSSGRRFLEALFYAFSDQGTLGIFKVTFVGKPWLIKTASIPYVNLFGSCSDPSGHVFVTQHASSGGGKIIEFAHGGTTAINTLSDSGMATACSYDRSTGNLAVANSYDVDAPGGPGPDVAVYAGASGSPTLYADRLSDSIQSCTYDTDGNLFIGGLKGYSFALTELPSAGRKVKKVALDQDIGGEFMAESVQWHRGSLFVTSVDRQRRHATHLYRFSVSNFLATVIETVKLHTVNGTEKALSPWTAIFGDYIVTTDRNGVAAWILPRACTAECTVGKRRRHQNSKANAVFVSVTASAIRTQ